ncbi:acyltransferase family protein [Evansella tamaricis]|uniref:Acyltransferase n=1 Tax=Evansella tamaricis TaxID=2069301 RepID=A0ABS6JII7_9BACI|nr:acyltransferase [Evansella tamaricis]
MSAERINWVDYAKGISIILVVLHHSMFRELDSLLYNETILYYNDLFIRIRMPLFFFLSGLFIHKSIFSNIYSFFKSKVLHLLYLFVLWAIIRYLVVTIAPYLLLGNRAGDLKSILSIFIDPPNTLWFIYAILIFLIITRLTRNIKVVSLFLAMILFTISIQSGQQTFINTLLWFYPFFLLGYLASEYTKRIANKIVSYHFLFVIIFFLTLVVTLESPWAKTPLAIFVFSCGGIITGIIIAIILSRFTVFRGLGFLGRNTLPIYLMHFLPVGILREVLPIIMPYQTLLATLILVFSGVLFPLIATFYARKFDVYWLFGVPFINRLNQPITKANSSVT